MRYVGLRNPRAETNPLRSIPLLRPASAVFGPTLRQKIEARLFIARRDLKSAEVYLPIAYAALGRANRSRGRRRFWQREAFQMINRTRAELHAARKALAAAEMELLALAGDLLQGAA